MFVQIPGRQPCYLLDKTLRLVDSSSASATPQNDGILALSIIFS